jgi:HEPN domain-containing protein
MKRPYETYQRWVEQAQHQLRVVESLLERAFWSDVCFMAEQTAQMALKAFLFGRGRRTVPIHSVQELAAQCSELDERFGEAVEWGKVLDRYYIPTRYPDALAPPAVPYRSFTEADGLQAHGYARDILRLVEGAATGGTGQ